MAKIETYEWKGVSGISYTFGIYPKNQKFNHVEGNYIFAKETDSGWDAVYIGEGFLDDRTQDEVHLKCAESKGFTHYHAHINENERARKDEETDLIEGNPECLEENGGCNQTATG